jgi:hypothetical protein
MKRPHLPDTLTTYQLPPSIAERVTGLPEAEQKALAALVKAVGEGGLDRIMRALAPGGRPSDYALRLPLLRQMAREMMAENPKRGLIGAGWQRGASSAAANVAKSPEGQRLGHSTAATQKWLTREWSKHGPRLMQDHRATMNAESNRVWDAMQEDHRRFNAILAPFIKKSDLGLVCFEQVLSNAQGGD